MDISLRNASIEQLVTGEDANATIRAARSTLIVFIAARQRGSNSCADSSQLSPPSHALTALRYD
jgi:hypothetical protein